MHRGRFHIAAACAGAAAAVLGLGAAGWAGAQVLHPVHPSASEGRVLQIRYEIVREAAYVPPAPTEETRLDTLGATVATAVDDGVLSAQSGQAWRQLQTEEDARNAAAIAAVRADDLRIDRETAAALRASGATNEAADAVDAGRS